MSLQAFTLIILAGLIHSGWNIVAKKAGGDARFSLYVSVCNALIWAPLGWWLGKDVVPGWGWMEWAFVTASALLHVAYFVVLLRGYRMADLTVVYPLARGSGPLMSSLVAVLFLGEQISTLGAAGIAGVVLGVFLIAGGPRMIVAIRDGKDVEARQRVLAGLYYGLLTGMFIASYTVVDSYAVKMLLMSPILVDYVGNLIRLVVLPRWPPRTGPRPSACGVCSGVMPLWWPSSVRLPMCWCCTRCKAHRSRTLRLRVKSPCCLQPSLAASCWARGTEPCALWAPS